MPPDSQPTPAEDVRITAMLRNFYQPPLRSFALLLWLMGLLTMAGMACCAVQFFRAQTPRAWILCATGFLTGMHIMAIVKVFAWQMIHRHALARTLTRIEERLARLDTSNR